MRGRPGPPPAGCRACARGRHRPMRPGPISRRRHWRPAGLPRGTAAAGRARARRCRAAGARAAHRHREWARPGPGLPRRAGARRPPTTAARAGWTRRRRARRANSGSDTTAGAFHSASTTRRCGQWRRTRRMIWRATVWGWALKTESTSNCASARACAPAWPCGRPPPSPCPSWRHCGSAASAQSEQLTTAAQRLAVRHHGRCQGIDLPARAHAMDAQGPRGQVCGRGMAFPQLLDQGIHAAGQAQPVLGRGRLQVLLGGQAQRGIATSS